ncbi:helix-turn-helix domain-containing protein, partial [Singulisphaera rosea]
MSRMSTLKVKATASEVLEAVPCGAPYAEPTMKFGEKLVSLLEKKQRTQYDLAAIVGRSQSRVSKWSNGVGHPTPSDMLAIARYFDVPMEFLADDSWDEYDGDEERNSREAAPAPPPLPSPSAPPWPPVQQMSGAEQLLWEAIRRIGVHEALNRILGTTGSSADSEVGVEYR